MNILAALLETRASLMAGDFAPEFCRSERCGCFAFHSSVGARGTIDALIPIRDELLRRFGPAAGGLGELGGDYLRAHGVDNKAIALEIIDAAIARDAMKSLLIADCRYVPSELAQVSYQIADSMLEHA